MDDLQRLRTRRRATKSSVTKLLGKVDSVLSADLEGINSQSIKEETKLMADSTLRQLKAKQSQLVGLDNSIAEKIDDEAKLEEEIATADAYQFELEDRIAHLAEFIRRASQSPPSVLTGDHSVIKPTSPPVPLDIPAVNSNASTDTQTPSATSLPELRTADDPVSKSPIVNNMQHSVSRLPKLSLPTFSGDSLQWQTFWDSFDAAVHSNVGLSGVQKFNYLRAQLHGDAARVVAGFPLTDANYMHSIDLLKDRFGQSYKISNAHLDALLNLPKPSNNLASLQSFHDTIERHMRSLSALGQSSESYAILLIPSIFSKLPIETKRNMARDHPEAGWSIEEVMAGIRKEVQIFEMSLQYSGKPSNHDSPLATTSSFHAHAYKSHHHSDVQQKKEPVCVFCKGGHKSGVCSRVTDPKERLTIVKRDNLCFNCLAKHKASQCTSKFSCRECKKRHHTSLCHAFLAEATQPSVPVQQPAVAVIPPEQQTSAVPGKEAATSDTASLTTMTPAPLTAMYTSVCLLKTAIAAVSSATTTTEGNILFDEGAQRSFITQALADELHLHSTHSETISVSSFGAQVSSARNLRVATLFIHTLNSARIPISVLIVEQLAAPIRNSVRTHLDKVPYLKGLTLAHPVTGDENFEISILIGADYYWRFVQDEVVRGDGPTAVNSRLGYLLSGPLPLPQPATSVSSHLAILSCTIPNSDMYQIWGAESAGMSPTTGTEASDGNEFLQRYMKTHISVQSDGTYCLRFPWRENHPPLPSNYTICSKRTRSLAYRLAKTPELLKLYGDIIKEQEQRGFIERAESSTDAHNVHYIPHHPVRKDSVTTPIRIVYDCSCKQSHNSPSLNDCLHAGPPFLTDLCTILLRFRSHSIALSADIEKAFLHVYLDQSDRDSTRFLWLSNPTNENSPFVTYRFRVVLFGASSSPFMLYAALSFHLTQNSSVVSQDLLHNLYVDNIVSGCPSEETALSYFADSRSLLSSAGFNLRSWSSNCGQLQHIASQHKVAELNNPVKVLGMYWNTESDTIYIFPSLDTTFPPTTTKREVLKWSSSIFDPLGLILPVTVSAKLFLQQLWQENLEWDTILDPSLCAQWVTIATSITQATGLSFPRKYNIAFPVPQDVSTSLHVFADASLKAYGAVAFIQQGQEPASILMSKARAAPLKQLTLPKLELNAAVLAARLAHFIMKSLTINLTTYLWSDSQIVLYWISSQKALKPYVSHRVAEIHSVSSTWKYCPSADNPADLLTRGITFQQFSSSTIWQQGPSWLSSPECWPTWDPTGVLLSQAELDLEEPDERYDTKQDESGPSPSLLNIIDIERYSNLEKLLAVTAHVLRFVNNTRHVLPVSTQHLTSAELSRANLKLLAAVQHAEFSREFSNLTSKSRRLPLVRQLRLFLDQNKLIRCGGRIHNAPLSELTRFPYLLPSKHYYTNLVIMQAHRAQHHCGVNATLTVLRQQYWIPSGRQRIRSLLRKCVICRKVSGRPYSTPDPPPLVKCRVNATNPFEVTGVDFTGALYFRSSEGERKAYVCLFTCAVSRAVHLEIVIDLTVTCFLQAFRRFASRRSLPKLMFSDNATTYLAAAEELQSLLSSVELAESLSRRGVEWRFIPKRAPWFGGFWERLIGLTKSALKKILGRSHATLESLQTIIVEVEAVLNNRPLTHVSADVNDIDPITPSHLLYGRSIVSLPYQRVEDDEAEDSTFGEDEDIRKRTKAQALLFKHFWARWQKEYLTSLREFHRLTGNCSQTIRVGDVVLIHDDSPRINWRLAVVESLNKGDDGLVRSATIRTSTGQTNRPIAKLYPLEVTAAELPQAAHQEKTVSNQSAEVIPRPMRRAAIEGRQRVKQWTGALCAPPEDVVD